MLKTSMLLSAGLVLGAIEMPSHAAVVDLGSASGNTITDEILALGWIRTDQPGTGLGGETAFVGTASAGATDFRGYITINLSGFSVGDTINSATLQLFSEGADTFDANGASTVDANDIDLNVTSLVGITGYGAGATIDAGGLAAGYTNLVGNGDLYGAVVGTAAGLNLDTIAVDTQIDFDVTAAIQAAVGAGDASITLGITSPEAIAAGNRNFFALGGVTNGSGGTDIGPNLNVDFTPVPEPGSLALLGLGGLVLARRRRA